MGILRRHSSNILIAALTATASLIIVPLARAQNEDTGFALLQKMRESERNVNFEGERTIEDYRGPIKVTTIQDVKQKDGITKITIIFPPSRRQQEFRIGPRQAENYRPWRNELRMRGLPPPGPMLTPERQLAALRERFSAVTTGRLDIVAGRRAHVVSLVPHGATQPVRTMWIDEEKLFCLKSEHYGADGRVVRAEYFTKIRFDPDIANGELEVNAPPGVRDTRPPPLARKYLDLPTVRARVGFPIAVPDPEGLPQGYEWLHDQVSLLSWHREPVVWLRFSNGLDYISLFERHARPGPPPGVSERTPSRLWLVWQEGAVQFVLIGPVTVERADLQRIKQHTHLPKPETPPPPNG